MSKTIAEAVAAAKQMHGRIHDAELEALAKYAGMVPAGQLILEIGSLYGKSTVCLSLATDALVVAVDNFSDKLERQHPTLVALSDNLAHAGCSNVLVWRSDSRQAAEKWMLPVHTLFIDGCHTYEFARADLFGFGLWTEHVIMLHDSHFEGVAPAIRDWLEASPEWRKVGQVDSVAILRRREASTEPSEAWLAEECCKEAMLSG